MLGMSFAATLQRCTGSVDAVQVDGTNGIIQRLLLCLHRTRISRESLHHCSVPFGLCSSSQLSMARHHGSSQRCVTRRISNACSCLGSSDLPHKPCCQHRRPAAAWRDRPWSGMCCSHHPRCAGAHGARCRSRVRHRAAARCGHDHAPDLLFDPLTLLHHAGTFFLCVRSRRQRLECCLIGVLLAYADIALRCGRYTLSGSGGTSSGAAVAAAEELGAGHCDAGSRRASETEGEKFGADHGHCGLLV